jgi:N-methylhydantoinase B
MDGKNAFAQSLAMIPGDKEAVSWGVFPLMGRDALYVRWNGGGGIGDSLAREVDRVGQDFTEHTISEEAMAQVYGVVMKAGEVDIEATTALREKMRRARMEQGVSA